MNDFNHINDFLNKFKNLLFKEEESRNIIVSIIKTYIPSNFDIKIKEPNITIKASPLVRSEILINKNKILSKVKELLPNSNFINIK